MAKKRHETYNLPTAGNDIADELIKRASEDMILKISFVGESPHMLFSHFRNMINAELEAHDLDPHNDAVLKLFVEAHAVELRDFVFTGVAIDHMVRVTEIESQTALTSGLMMTDVWDSLKSHIAMAEERFKKQAADLPEMIRQLEKQGGLGAQSASN